MKQDHPFILVPCPICQGNGRNPEAPAAIAEDEGTCPTCCDPSGPWYAAWHGRVRVSEDFVGRLLFHARECSCGTP